MDYLYCCAVERESNSDGVVDPSNTDMFITVTANFSLLPEADDSDRSSEVIRRVFVSPMVFMIGEGQEEVCEDLVAHMLSAVHIPHVDDSLIDEICKGINSIADPFRLSVTITLLVDRLPRPDPVVDRQPIDLTNLFYSSSDDEEEEYNVVSFVPASRDSIKGLKRVRVSAADCSVCMEHVTTDSVAISLPCSHTFHENCIVEWLNTSKFCPLCRFELPAAAN